MASFSGKAVLFAAVLALSQAGAADLRAPFLSKPMAQTAFVYVAQFAKPVRTSGTVVASGISWTCSGQECRVSGPWPEPGVPACHALALQQGVITSYGRVGHMLSPADLGACNAGVNAQKVVFAPVPLQSLSVVASPPSKSGNSQSSSPPSGPPFDVTTAQLRAVGGSDVMTSAFTPVTVTTASLRVVGGTDVVTAPFTPVEVTTHGLSVVGGP